VTTTPTGHTYTSHAPPLLPGLPPALADHDVGHPDADPDADEPDAIETDAHTPEVADSATTVREPARMHLYDLEQLSPFGRIIALRLVA
jgi:hypothetical protein